MICVSVLCNRIMTGLRSATSLLLTILCVLLSQHATCQHRTMPFGLGYSFYQTIPEKNFGQIDTTTLAEQRKRSSSKIVSETVAYNFKTHFEPGADDNWRTVVPGFRSWFLKLRSHHAYGLALVFTHVRLQEGESLSIYNQHGLRGPYTKKDIPRSGILPLDFLQGDEIVIEYDVPASDEEHGTFIVETLSHAYRNIFLSDHQRTGVNGRYSDDCYLCLQNGATAREARAVVKLVVQYENSAKLCTGTLVNNTTGNHVPYVLTAQHCVSDQAEADRTVFIFGYDDEACSGQTRYDLMLPGAYHRASLFENDFALLELYNKPSLEFHPWYAGWDISDRQLTGVMSIHHAQGGPKRISVSNTSVVSGDLNDGAARTPGAYWNVVRWDMGATESGSSGASLLNSNNNIIGTLSGGGSQCGAPYNDYFAKLSAAWEPSVAPEQQLKHWLDPAGSGIKQLEGSDPFEGINVNCKTLTNIKPGEHQEMLAYTSGPGYFSGYNSDGIASYAEKFSVTDSVRVTGATLMVGSVNVHSPGGLVVAVHKSVAGVPGPVMSELFVPYDRLREDSLNHVAFHPYVKLAGDFFISYTLSYSPEDSFALKQSGWRNDLNNTAYAKPEGEWVPMNTISPGGASSSLGIKVSVCEDSVMVLPAPQKSVILYPNPVTTVLIGKLPDDVHGEWRVQVCDLQGKAQRITWHVYEGTVVIGTADLGRGMYVVRISAGAAMYQSKFIKQ